jgi:hypothetical protein
VIILEVRWRLAPVAGDRCSFVHFRAHRYLFLAVRMLITIFTTRMHEGSVAGMNIASLGTLGKFHVHAYPEKNPEKPFVGR